MAETVVVRLTSDERFMVLLALEHYLHCGIVHAVPAEDDLLKAAQRKLSDGQ